MYDLKEISVNKILGVSEDIIDSVGTQSLVLSYLRKNPEGVTANMVAATTNISANRARTILKELCYVREAYFRKMLGIREKLYYANGQLIHKYLQESKDLGNQIFRISVHEGRRSPRFQIQERKFSLMDGEKVEGSIFIDIEQVPKMMEFLNEMMDKFNFYKQGDAK